ncbi:MAG: DegV family protein [Acidimicrobiia bacterium]|nr:DegV family protein [Acidimicrobiia bacterium]
MGTVRIVTDSSCDLSITEADQAGIIVVPLTIRFGDEEFVDRAELDPTTFYAKMAASDTLPETAAPSPGAFEEAFRAMAADGATSVLCINLSLGLSATGQSAQAAADAMADELDVRVIDSHSITCGLGSIVLRGADAAASGMAADDVEALVRDLGDRTHVFGVLDTLENLKKGGRVGGAKALVGSMLSIKPLLDLSSGVVEEAGRQRTRKRALQWLADKLGEYENVENVAVAHGDAPDHEAFLEMLSATVPRDQIRVGKIGPVIGTHGGPRVMGMSFTVID